MTGASLENDWLLIISITIMNKVIYLTRFCGGQLSTNHGARTSEAVTVGIR